MTIEFYTPEGEVREWIIKLIKDQLTELHRKNKKISRAEVHFRDQKTIKVCEIELITFGESIIIQRFAGHYDEAASAALTELKSKMEESKMRNESPDKVISTLRK